MLARPAEHANHFTRRDAGRLILASILLIAAMSVILGLDVLPAPPQGFGLGLPPPLGHGLREVGEEHREPEPQGDLSSEGRGCPGAEEV